MTRKTKQMLGILALVLLICTPVLAQGSKDLGRLQPAGTGVLGNQTASDSDDCCRVIPPRRVLVRVLELDDEQLAQVQALAEEIVAAVGPLAEQLKMLAEDLRIELGSDDPEPCVIGGLILDIRNLKAEICRTIRSFEDDFFAILNEAQAARWEEIKDRFCRHRRHDREGEVESDG